MSLDNQNQAGCRLSTQMDERVKALAAQGTRIAEKEAAQLAAAEELRDGLNAAFHNRDIYAVSTIVDIEMYDGDSWVYGRLRYFRKDLEVLYRTPDDDMADSQRPDARENGTWHIKQLKDCTPKWQATMLSTEMITSLLNDFSERLTTHEQQLDRSLSAFQNLPLFEATDVDSLPAPPRDDLIKAAQRFRDGDLSGAIAAACGAVDTVVDFVLRQPNPKPSFQEGCNRAFKEVLNVQSDLQELGWTESEAMMLADNFKRAMSAGAYVMQSLRSKMGDVHGTKPVLLPLAFDTLKWAEIMVRTLATREIER
ncbi:hypothetical protein [Burkholderia stabilis]|nr:hypothetical protein [Burkholderia stabilis]